MIDNINISYLYRILSLLYSDSLLVSKTLVSKVLGIFAQDDLSKMQDDHRKLIIKIIVYTAERRLDGVEPSLLLSELEVKDGDTHSRLELEMNDSAISHLDVFISEISDYKYITESMPELEKLIDEFDYMKSDPSRNHYAIEKFNQKFKNKMDGIQRQMYLNAPTDIATVDDFDDDNLINIIDKTIHHHKNIRKIQTGIKALNAMLNGGFENGRVYLFLAVAKGGKSMKLLQDSLWVKKYNTFPYLKKQGLKPVVLYLTMENSQRETFERIYSHYGGNEEDFKEMPTSEIVENLKNVGYFDTHAGLAVKYRAYRSINTQDIDNIIDEMEATNKNKVVMVVLDYVARIRSVERAPDLRLELSAIANELGSIAKKRDIPIVTAAQLNRGAFEISEMDGMGAADAMKQARRISATHIAEAINLVQNVDVAVAMVKTVISIGQQVVTPMLFKMLASRTKSEVGSLFFHEMENGMKFYEDVYDKEVNKTYRNDDEITAEYINSIPHANQLDGKRQKAQLDATFEEWGK